MKKKKKQTRKRKTRAEALALIRDPLFLFRVGRKIQEIGLVGELRNRVLLFLAALTKDLCFPISVLVKGPSSVGKSNLLRNVLELFPPECVIKRASLSKKAPVYGADELKGKLLYLFEYRGGKDALLLTRLLQSEGEIVHEYTTGAGRHRGTAVVSRKGTPVVLTTTTQDKVYEDDETRFLSIRADDSPEQTQAVLRAQFAQNPMQAEQLELPVWHEAIRILGQRIPNFRHPAWFGFLAEQIPADEPRARRDSPRFLSLLRAVALCRSHSDRRVKEGGEVEINFSDYCVTHRIVSKAFTLTFAGAHPKSLELAKAVRLLGKESMRPPSVTEVAKHLGWKQSLVYKFTKIAIRQRLIEYESGTRLWNQKRLLPGPISSSSFLPDPLFVFRKRRDVGDVVRYIDPLTGKKKILRRPGRE